jgi:hypothetical protein
MHGVSAGMANIMQPQHIKCRADRAGSWFGALRVRAAGGAKQVVAQYNCECSARSAVPHVCLCRWQLVGALAVWVSRLCGCEHAQRLLLRCAISSPCAIQRHCAGKLVGCALFSVLIYNEFCAAVFRRLVNLFGSGGSCPRAALVNY